MLAADSNIKSYISLAGPGESVEQTLIKQLQKQSPDLAKTAQEHINELMKTDTIQSVNPYLIQLFAPQNQKFLKSWMLYNPSEEIKKIKKPILIVQGDADLQVTTTDAQLLLSALTTTNTGFGAPAQLVTIENMNHVLKTVVNITENQASYYDPDFEIPEALLSSLSNFIKTNG